MAAFAGVVFAGVVFVGVGSDVPFAARGATAISFVVAAAAARIDQYELRLPNRLVSIIFALGLIAGVAANDLRAVLVAAAVAAAPFLVMHLIEPGSIGFGDVKYSAACGSVIGVLSVLAAPLMVSVTLAVAIVNRVGQPNRARPLGPIIFGGTIAAAIVVVMLRQRGVLR